MPDPIQVEGLNDLLRSFRAITPRLRRGLTKELRAAAGLVADAARAIAEQKGLRESGALIKDVRPMVRGSIAYVRETATRVSAKYPEGYPYPRVYEFGHGKTRAFMFPAADVASGKVEERLERLVDTVLDDFQRGT